MLDGRARNAFTLVELLVVVAIIGALAGMILPAVQASRASARKSQCQNNLRQIGLAYCEFESMRAELPIGCIGCRTNGNEMLSWNVQLLPYLEQDSLAAAYQVDVPSYRSPNRELGETVLSVFLCPDTQPDTLISERGLWRGQAFTDYGGIYGVEGDGRDAEPEEQIQTLSRESLGVFLFENAVQLSQITDGLSRTVGVAERVTRRISTAEWASGRNIFAHDGQTPINQPSGLGNDIGSPHAGGALLTFCDGHTQFVSGSIAQQVLNGMLTKAGGEAK
ncbi:MAG: DUF1559 domain-containing protein [Planctomycetota bacterium]